MPTFKVGDEGSIPSCAFGNGLMVPFDANIDHLSLSEAKLIRGVQSNEINTVPDVEKTTEKEPSFHFNRSALITRKYKAKQIQAR